MQEQALSDTMLHISGDTVVTCMAQAPRKYEVGLSEDPGPHNMFCFLGAVGWGVGYSG